MKNNESETARAALVAAGIASLGVLPWIGRSFDLAGLLRLQLFEIVAALLLLVWILDLLRLEQRVVFPNRLLDLMVWACLGGVLLVALAGLLSAVNAISLVHVMRFEFRYLLGFLLVLFLIRVLRTESRISLLIDSLLFGAAASVAVSVAGYLIPQLGETTLRYGDRAQALLNHPNQLGMMLVVTLPLALSPLARSLALGRSWLLPILIVAGIALSGSKANLVLTLLIIPFVLLALNGLRRGLVARLAGLAAVVFGAMVSVVAAVAVLEATSPRTLVTLGALTRNPLETSTVSSRLELWGAAVALSQAHFPFGVGADHTGVYLPFDHAHNVFVEFLVTTGWFGLGAVVALVGSVVVLSLHAIRSAGRARAVPLQARARTVALAFGCLAYIASNQSSDSFGAVTIVIFWVLLALLVAQLRLLPAAPEPSASERAGNGVEP